MRLLSGFIAILCVASSLEAQATLGSAAVSGSVRDNTGATVPDARVVLREIARGLDRDTVTNSAGAFLFPTVPPGEYSLRVTKEGFDAEQIRSFNLEVGQRASFDMELKVGQISTVVQVEAGNQVLLETESNAIGTVVDSARVQGLPLNGRNFLQLALLSGGVVEPTTHSDSIQGQIGRSGRAVILAGNLGGSTGYLINGISTRGGRLGESALNLSVSSIDQFKVQLSFFMPDQGPNPGLVNITTKGGTNAYHGEAFEFVRNDIFDARNFFAPAPENLHRNQFGFAVGGPILKDKLWFFGNYEGLREITAFSASGYAPTQAMFGGNFAEVPQPIYDPQTFDAATGTRQPFPGNIIPSNRINPVAAKLLQYYLPGSSLAQRPSNLFGNPRNQLNDDQYGIRIDAALTPVQNLFGQFINQNDPAVQPGLEPLSGARFPADAQLAMVQHTWSLRPTFVNTLRIGFVRNSVFQSGEAQALGHVLGGIGVANTLDDRGISGISIQGFQAFGHSTGDLGNADNNYQLDEGANYVRGSHNYQFGMSVRYRRTIQQNANASALGNLGFQPTFTAQLASNGRGQLAPVANTGNAFADYLLGIPTTGQLVGLPRLPYRYTQYMPYFEDTWKVTRSLTLNYGISWFLATVPEPQGSAAKLPHGFDYQTGLLKFAALGEVDPRILKMAKKNFTPRFGFAWKPSFLPNTVIRSGAGIYYSDTRLIELQFAMVSPPFNSPQTVNNSPNSPLPQYVLGNNIFPPPPNLPLDKNYAASLPAGTSAFLLNPDGKNPYVTQWNFSIQHSIRANDIVELVYLGSSGHRQQDRYEYAECRPGPDLFCDPNTKPYPRYSSLLTADYNGNTSYEAGIAKFYHQSSGGLSFRVEYTFAKALDDNWEGGDNFSQYSSCRKCDRGPAAFDVKHRAVISTIYDLPFGHGRRFGGSAPALADEVLGGWTLTGIGTFATGNPFNVTGANTVGFSNITVRANRLCDGRDSRFSDHLRSDGLKDFDTSCFANPAVGYFGNSSRNVLYAPGINNWDIGVEKFFPIPIREGMRLQFRAEFFNAFNHTQFGAPNSAVTSGANFGLISSARAPRLIQLGMKLQF